MSSFQIQQFTRVRDDPCDQVVQNKEAMGPGSYNVTNLVPAASTTYGIAYDQLAIPAAPGYGWSAAEINADSLLRNHAIQANSPHCPLRGRVQARPFSTVPYMGRGRGDADVLGFRGKRAHGRRDHAHARILRRVLPRHGQRVIRGSVIDDQQFRFSGFCHVRIFLYKWLKQKGIVPDCHAGVGLAGAVSRRFNGRRYRRGRLAQDRGRHAAG